MPTLPRPFGAGPQVSQPRGGRDAGQLGGGGGGCELRGPSQEICIWKRHPFARLAGKQIPLIHQAAFLEHSRGFCLPGPRGSQGLGRGREGSPVSEPTPVTAPPAHARASGAGLPSPSAW